MGRKMPTMTNNMNAPMPTPGIQLVDGLEKMAVAVGVNVIVLVGGMLVAVKVGVSVGVGVCVEVVVGVIVCVAVGGAMLGVFFPFPFPPPLSSGTSVAGHGIDPPAASVQPS